MSIVTIIAITAIVVPAMITFFTLAIKFGYHLSSKLTELASNQKLIEANQISMKEDLKSYIKLFFNDERIMFEKKFDEIEKIINDIKTNVQSNRHNINNLTMRVDSTERRVVNLESK